MRLIVFPDGTIKDYATFDIVEIDEGDLEGFREEGKDPFNYDDLSHWMDFLVDPWMAIKLAVRNDEAVYRFGDNSDQKLIRRLDAPDQSS